MGVDYYRALASAVVRAGEHPTSPNDRIYQFLDFGLTYGPSEEWPDTLMDAWVIGSMPDPKADPSDPKALSFRQGRWPVHENIEKLIELCQKYLKETS